MRYHVIKFDGGKILTAGRPTPDIKEANHRTGHLAEIETDEDAEIRVVDDLELLALLSGKRCIGDASYFEGD